MATPTDGQAVATVRALLEGDGVRTEHPWRATVVAEEDGWVVRTWTETPLDLARPAGRPQFVHRVRLAPAVEHGLGAELVWSEQPADES